MKTKILIAFIFMLFFKTKLIANIIFSKKGIVLLIPIVVTANVIDVKLALLVLFTLMAIDFASGISGSYFVRKKQLKELSGEDLKKLKESNLISSEKLKLSGVKFIFYMVFTLLAFIIESVFFIKSFDLSFSEAKLKISIIAILLCCLIEIYSIVFENFKKMGFDVTAIFSKIFKKYKSLKSGI